MAGLIYQLIDAINRESDLYEDLLSMSFEKNKIIIKGDVDTLNSFTKSEHELVSKIQSIEKKRIDLVRDISVVLNQNPDDMTISKLSSLLSGQPEDAASLSDAGIRLRGLLEKIKEINSQNSDLIKQSLEYIDFTMNAIQSSFELPVSAGYGKDGNIQPGVSFFDRKQ